MAVVNGPERGERPRRALGWTILLGLTASILGAPALVPILVESRQSAHWPQLEGVAPKTLVWMDLDRWGAYGPPPRELSVLAGTVVEIPGYIVPLDDGLDETAEFLLVPWLGACVHTPSPPENQIVAVKMVDGPIAVDLWSWEPVWVAGRFGIGLVESPFGPAAYTLQGLATRPYEQEQ